MLKSEVRTFDGKGSLDEARKLGFHLFPYSIRIWGEGQGWLGAGGAPVGWGVGVGGWGGGGGAIGK